MGIVNNLVKNKLHPITGEDLKPTVETVWCDGVTPMSDALCGGLYNKDTQVGSPTFGSYFKWRSSGPYPLDRLVNPTESNFFKLISDFGATPQTVVVNKLIPVSVNRTVPANITLQFENGGGFNVLASKTLSILGSIKSELFQIFFGAGSVEFQGYTSNTEWFGSGASSDDSDAILRAHSRGSVVEYQNKPYKFTSATNPDLSSGLKINRDTKFNGLKYDDILIKDREGKVIGIHHNHREETNATLGGKLPVTSGTLLDAPLSTAEIVTDIHVGAHFYNDGGLRRTIAGGGDPTWYYWKWNFHDAVNNPTGYDPSRHPLLGWYRGDDPKVLDWQCYWVKEAGMKFLNLHSDVHIDTNQWQNPTDFNHWLYQLFENAKNFKRLKYVLWGVSGSSGADTAATIEANWINKIDNIYGKYDNFYYVEKAGKMYPVMFVFEGELLRGKFDNFLGAVETRAFYIRMANKFKALGYGGICLFVRHHTGNAVMNFEYLEQNDVIYIPASYSETSGVDGVNGTYDDFVNGVQIDTSERRIANIVTSYKSKSPHPSNFNRPGNTPEKFKAVCKKVVKQIRNSPITPKILMVYNLAEWAEAGAPLQPNMQDGFAYLDAIRDVIQSGYDGTEITIPLTTTVSIDSTNINPSLSKEALFVTSSAPKSLNVSPYLPTIQSGRQGQSIKIINTGNHNITLFDNALVAGTSLNLDSETLILKPNYAVELAFNYVTGFWIELSRGINSEPVIEQNIQAASIDPVFSKTIRIFSTFAQDLTSATHQPTVKAGIDGQIIELMNIPKFGSYSVTLRDDANTAGTKLFLKSAALRMAPYDCVRLQYSSIRGGWVEIYRTASMTQRLAYAADKTASYTLTFNDFYVGIDATAGNLVANLPTATNAFNGGAGQIYVITKTDNTANTVTVTGTINGVANYVLSKQWQSVTVQSTGTGTTFRILSASETLITASVVASGNGTNTVNIPHGLGVVPSFVCMPVPLNAASAGIDYVTKDATNIILHFSASTVNAVNNLAFDISYKR